MNIRWSLWLFFILGTAVAINGDCNYYQAVSTGKTYYIYNQEYPNNYAGAQVCQWTADCPDQYNCRLDCPLIQMPPSTGCMLDKLTVTSGDSNPTILCVHGAFNNVLTGQKMSLSMRLGLVTSQNTTGGRFLCNLSAQRISLSSNCTCGAHRQGRIVSGEETGVNEYPMMAGIVDIVKRDINCGAVIISARHLLTSAQCVQNSSGNIGVFVGENKVTTGDNPPATKLYDVENTIIHDQYSTNNNEYDIAIVTVAKPIKFSDSVSPVCLPFKFKENTNDWLDGHEVTMLGWGHLQSGGQKPNVLRKVDLNVIGRAQCLHFRNNITTRQICTFSIERDACQLGVGGPVLYTDPDSSLLFNVGLMSEDTCSSGEPSVSIKITAFLDWIVASTKAEFCVK